MNAKKHPSTKLFVLATNVLIAGLKIVVAGGTAGRFSAVIPGWTFANGSNLVIKKIHA